MIIFGTIGPLLYDMYGGESGRKGERERDTRVWRWKKRISMREIKPREWETRGLFLVKIVIYKQIWGREGPMLGLYGIATTHLWCNVGPPSESFICWSLPLTILFIKIKQTKLHDLSLCG